MGRYLLALLAVGAAAGSAVAGEDYRFTLAGKAIDPPRIAVAGTPGTPAPGDLVRVDGIWLVLDDPGEYDFVRRRERLLRRTPEGWTLAGLCVVNPPRPPALTAEERRSLRGVSVIARIRTAVEFLGGLDGERLCVTADMTRARGYELVLPANLGSLVLEGGRNEPESIRALRGHDALRVLVARRTPILLSDLRVARNLRVLEAPGCRVDRAAVLGGMGELRRLVLDGARGLDSVDFVRELPELRHLGIERTAVTDLGPLSGHPSLVELRLTGTPIRTLPAAPLPRLETVVALGTEVPRETWLAFEALHPGLAATWSRLEMLRRAAAGADRIRVRSGGTCHRRPENEKTLFEQTGRDEVEALFARLDIDEKRSGGECMCCGDPTLELLEGDRLLVAVGIHHGVRLRFVGWRGDSGLTDESALALVDWLAENGVTEPREEVRQTILSRRAVARRRAAIRAVVPMAALEAFDRAEDDGARRAALELAGESPAERARMGLRALGGHDGDWAWRDTLDGAFLALLDDTGPSALREALAGLGEDAAAARGLARWLFEEGAAGRLPQDLVREVLPVAGREGAAHPGERSRRRALNELGRIGGAAAIEILREVLAGTLRPRDLGPDGTTVLPGLIRIRREAYDVVAGSDRVVAAVHLGRLGDGASLAAIRELRSVVDPEDVPQVDRAIGMLAR